MEIYGCADSTGCERKSRWPDKYNMEKNPYRNKAMRINKRREEQKEESNADDQREEGSRKRLS